MTSKLFATKAVYKRLEKTEEWDPTKLNTSCLLQEIKKHPFIYNPNHTNYRDRILKRTVWDRICRKIYPQYPQCREAVKLHILSEMHRRWMHMRCAIRREAKIIVRSGIKRKTVRPEISQLLFLIPYIHSPECQKLTEKWDIKRLPNDNEMLDLAEDGEPSTQQPSNEEELEFFDEYDELEDDDLDGPQQTNKSNILNPEIQRKLTDPVEAEKQRKLLEYLTKFEKRQLQQEPDTNDENDRDRMFLLSLVEDFKRIPANKKIYVKAKIATVLTQAAMD